MDFIDGHKKTLYFIMIFTTLFICLYFYKKYEPNAYEIKMNNKYVFYIKDKNKFEEELRNLQKKLNKEYENFKIEDKFVWEHVHIEDKYFTPTKDIKNIVTENINLKLSQYKGKLNKQKGNPPSKSVLGREIKLLRPCKGNVTSPFGIRGGRMHKGVDIGNFYNTPICAAYDGIITYAGWIDGYGKAIKIDHGGGMETLYAHCNVIKIKEGDKVKKGQVIGNMGSTGRSTGPHVHFEVRINGEAKNPYNYM